MVGDALTVFAKFAAVAKSDAWEYSSRQSFISHIITVALE
jgi:hypothetical protein